MDRKQGLLGGFLDPGAEEPTDGPDDPSGEPAATDRGAPPLGGDRVDAYEEDWYRSLKALASRRAEFGGDEEEEEGEEAVPETAQEAGASEAYAPVDAASPQAVEAEQPPAADAIPEAVAGEITEPQPRAAQPDVFEALDSEMFGEPSGTPAAEAEPEVLEDRASVAEAPAPALEDDAMAIDIAPWIDVLPSAGPAAEVAAPEGAEAVEATLPNAEVSEELPPEPATLPDPPSSGVQLRSEAATEPPPVTPTPEPVPVEDREVSPDVPPSETPAPLRLDEPTEPSLTARDPAQRRMALEEIGARELADGELDQVRGLVLDPDQGVRHLAIRVLSRIADRLDDATIRQALQDPADDVRAAAVRLAAERGARDLKLLAPLAGAKRWPHTQAAVLEVLPDLIATMPSLGESELDLLLTSVGEMESGPAPDERAQYARLGRAVGVSRLIGSLSRNDIRRLGAVRILMEGDDAPEILRALATLVSDPIDEVREVAEVAADVMARVDIEAAERDETPEDAPVGPVEAERIASLARSLRDPDEAVRHLARSGLTSVERSRVLAWTREALHTGDSETASAAAETVGVLRLFETGVDILNRAIEVPPEDREPFLTALARLRLEDLVGLLELVDEARKPEAVRVLWRTSGPNVLPHLRAHLDDPSVPVRMAVLDVMGEAGDANGADVARFVLETDQAPVLRAAAIRVIGRTGVEASQALSRAMADPEPAVRIAALEELTPRLGREADPQLLRALSDPDEQVRRAAMDQFASRLDNDPEFVWSAIGQCRPEERTELGSVFAQSNPGALTKLALEHCSSPDQQDRVLAAELAGWSKSQACVEAAIQALRDPAPAVRAVAAKALGRLKDPSAVRALGDAMADPYTEVRVEAVRALGVIDDEAVLGLLVAALQDPDPQVSTITSEVLTQWSSPAVAKRLAGVLAVPNLRDAAVDLLRKIGPSSQELMIDVLLYSGPEVDAVVGTLLGEVVGLEILTERLSATEADVRLRGVEAVGAVGGQEAVDALIRVLSDPDERIRLRAVRLLAQLDDPRAATAIEQSVLNDPVPEVVAAAQDTFARLRGGADPPLV